MIKERMMIPIIPGIVFNRTSGSQNPSPIRLINFIIIFKIKKKTHFTYMLSIHFDFILTQINLY